MGTFPVYKALRDEARQALNRKRGELKTAERSAWTVGKAHCMALLEDKLRRIKTVRARTAEANEAIRNGVVDIRVFERLMLKGGA